MTTVTEQVRTALEWFAGHHDWPDKPPDTRVEITVEVQTIRDARSALAALDAEPEGLETTPETRKSMKRSFENWTDQDFQRVPLAEDGLRLLRDTDRLLLLRVARRG